MENLENESSENSAENLSEDNLSSKAVDKPVKAKMPKKRNLLGLWIGSGILLVLIVLGFVFKDALLPASSQPTAAVEGDTSQIVALVNGQGLSRKSFDIRFSVVTGQLGKQPVTLDQINDEANSKVKTQVIDDLINSELLAQAAGQADITADNGEVDAQLQQIIDQAGGEEALKASLAINDIDIDFVRQDLAEQIIIQKYLKDQLKDQDLAVTEEEINKTYEQAASSNPDVPPLAQVKDQVKASLVNQKTNAAVNAHLDNLRQNAKIEILF